MNSGAEAVETALKAARKWGYTVKGIRRRTRRRSLSATNNFHGRTISIVGFSSDEQYRDGFGPFPPGFRHVPFGDVEALRRAITPQYLRVSGGADPGRGGDSGAAGGLSARGRGSVPRDTMCC